MAGRKRANGEGSISQHPDGRWWARVTLANGKRKAFYGKTRREVQEKLTATLRDMQQGIAPTPQQETIAQYLTRWLEHTARPTVRPKTYHSYAQLVRLHLVPGLGRHRLAALGPQPVQQFLNDKLAAGLSPRTVQYLRAILRRALGQALKWGLVARNVVTLVDSPRVRRPEVEPFTPDQARAFLAAVQGDRLEALYTVAVALGLRQGEALGLRWADVDLDAGTLRVAVALQRIDGELRFVEPKSQRSRRTLPLPPRVVAALRAHRARQLEERLQAGPYWQDHRLVFPTTLGTPLDARNVTRWYHRLLDRAELPHRRFHDLRHTAASLLLVQGVAPRVVMETLGHSQISLTMDTYSHVMPVLQRDAAEQMEAILAAGG
jgi:integrase